MSRAIPGLDGEAQRGARTRRDWRRSLVMVAGAVVFVTGAIITLLFLTVNAVQITDRLEIIKTGLTAGAGAGALIALLYVIRRQLLAEEIARDAKQDATEKRVIELYSKGVEHLNSENASVRLGGLYALERLGETTPTLREQIIDIICACIGEPDELDDRGQTSAKSRHVKAAAGNILIDHLAFESRHNVHKTHWPVGLMSLSGIELREFMFIAAKVHAAHFAYTRFIGRALFIDANIRGADFVGAVFTGPARFDSACLGKGIFASAKFDDEACFVNVRFRLQVDFSNAQFARPPCFKGARIHTSALPRAQLPSGWEIRLPVGPADDEWASVVPSSSD